VTTPAAANLIYGYYLGVPKSTGFDGVQEADEYGNLNTDWFLGADSCDAYDLSVAMHEALLAQSGMTGKEWDALEDETWVDELVKRTGVRILLLGYAGIPQIYLVTDADWVRGEVGMIPGNLQSLYPSPGGEAKLRSALRKLHITPKARHPRWMLVPYVN
jgi:hypothetical protein